MRVAGVPFALATLLAASLSQAQYLISELSFGHAGRIAPPEDPNNIPFFALQGSPKAPEILSNKIILTPLAPGNHRGAVWSTQTLLRDTWIADVDFRANGPERGGGNLNIWLVRGGQEVVRSSSIYTAPKFDGLALVIDGHGGQSGMIRGFLNDGSIDFSQRSDVDSLAFGHCPYSYRNLGRPSQIKMRQTATSFKVEVDGKLCFETSKVKIPTGNQFGVTAATPDTPDSFELFKLVVMTENSNFEANQVKQNQQQQTPSKAQPNQQQGNQQQSNQQQAKDPYAVDDIPDEDADIFQTSKTQFMDLHNRLQSTNHQLSSIHRTVSRHQQMDDKRHDEIKQLLGDVRSELRKLESIGELQRQLRDLEGEIRSIKSELSRKIQANERTVKSYLSEHHSTLSQTVAESKPGHGLLIAVFLGTQVVVVVGYVLYKRRRATMPKKFL